MLLIILLGLIAKLASVCDGCEVGHSKVNNFDWNQFSGPEPWYVFWHSKNIMDKKIAFVVLNYGVPEGNTSSFILNLFVVSIQLDVTVYANVTNWNCNGYDQVFDTTCMWSGRFYAIAVDYDRYFILKHCPFDSNKPYVYVGFRSKHPDKETMNDVLKDLQENDINVNELESWWPTGHITASRQNRQQ